MVAGRALTNMDKWHLWANTPGIKALFMGVNRGALDWTWTLDKKGLWCITIFCKSKAHLTNFWRLRERTTLKLTKARAVLSPMII